MKGKLSAEDMRVLQEIAEQLVLGDELPSIRECRLFLEKRLWIPVHLVWLRLNVYG